MFLYLSFFQLEIRCLRSAEAGSGVIDDAGPAAACQVIIPKYHESRRFLFSAPRSGSFAVEPRAVELRLFRHPSPDDPGSDGRVCFPRWISDCCSLV